MSNAIKIYQEIIADFKKAENSSLTVLNRSILLKNKIRIVYIVAAKNHQRIIAVMLPKDCTKEPLSRFPKWHGIEFAYDHITEYQNPNSENEYIIISQSKDYDSGIFEIIANDITDQLEKIEGLLILQDNSVSEEHIADIIKWVAGKTKNSEKLRDVYISCLDIVI